MRRFCVKFSGVEVRAQTDNVDRIWYFAQEWIAMKRIAVATKVETTKRRFYITFSGSADISAETPEAAWQQIRENLLK